MEGVGTVALASSSFLKCLQETSPKKETSPKRRFIFKKKNLPPASELKVRAVVLESVNNIIAAILEDISSEHEEYSSYFNELHKMNLGYILNSVEEPSLSPDTCPYVPAPYLSEDSDLISF